MPTPQSTIPANDGGACKSKSAMMERVCQGSLNALVLTRWTAAIDPGHGGYRSGSLTLSGSDQCGACGAATKPRQERLSPASSFGTRYDRKAAPDGRLRPCRRRGGTGQAGDAPLAADRPSPAAPDRRGRAPGLGTPRPAAAGRRAAAPGHRAVRRGRRARIGSLAWLPAGGPQRDLAVHVPGRYTLQLPRAAARRRRRPRRGRATALCRVRAVLRRDSRARSRRGADPQGNRCEASAHGGLRPGHRGTRASRRTGPTQRRPQRHSRPA
jgi:hypothetical protein